MPPIKRLDRLTIAMLIINAALTALAVALYFGRNELRAFLHPPQEVNFAAPRLTSLTDLSGAPVSLEDYRGSVVLVNLWATWCPPCRAEMPALQAFYQKYKDKGFVVVAINQRESREQVAAFVAEQGLTFPFWLDPAGEAEMKFNTNALPSSYVLDRSGRARLAWIGGVSQRQLEQYIPHIIYESQE